MKTKYVLFLFAAALMLFAASADAAQYQFNV